MRGVSAALVALSSAALSAPPTAEANLRLGENANGREILVDPTTMKNLPPVRGARTFAVTQIYVVMQGPSAKDSTERVRYNFNCAARTAATITYYRTLKGQRTHDWRGADIKMKYYPVERGGLVELALGYACSGGKMPLPDKRTAPSRSEEGSRDADGG